MRKSAIAGSASEPGRGRPADERRDRAGGAADDDVLRRRALQPAGVDEDVEEVADERERRRQDVDAGGEDRERERRQREAELERVRRRDPVRGHGPRPRALPHQPVDVAVEHMVEGARAAARQREADHRRDGDLPRRQAARAGDEAAEAGQQEQRHDPRLRQRDVVAEPAERLARLAVDEHGEDERRGEGGGREREVDSRRGDERRDAEQAEGDERGGQQLRGGGATRRRRARRAAAARAPPARRASRRARRRPRRPRAARPPRRRQPSAGASRSSSSHASPEAACAGRGAGAGSRRTGAARPSSRAAEARSRTTRACRRPTGRCRRAGSGATGATLNANTSIADGHHERADGREPVVDRPRPALGVRVDPPRHAEQAEEVLRHEREVEAREHQPEVPLAEPLVEAAPEHLRPPVVHARRRSRTPRRRTACSGSARRRSTCRAPASRRGTPRRRCPSARR